MVFIYVKENIKYNEVNCKYGSTFLYSCSLHCPLLYPVFGKVTSLNVSLHIIMNFNFFYNLLTPGFLDVLICLHIHNASYISVFLSGIEFSFILTESDWKPKRAGDVTSGLVSELATTLLKTQTEITYCSVLLKNKLRVETKLSFWDLLMKPLEKDKRSTNAFHDSSFVLAVFPCLLDKKASKRVSWPWTQLTASFVSSLYEPVK